MQINVATAMQIFITEYTIKPWSIYQINLIVKKRPYVYQGILYELLFNGYLENLIFIKNIYRNLQLI